ncbi:hypothetical protein RPALISO_216 [Ruegeria phage RpAliso]|nr:hypothetical protein RPALISO_216 [Ruegeria phage RpAliso]
MKLNETQKGLIETAMISAIDKWREMVKDVENDTHPVAVHLTEKLGQQIVDARQLLHLIQDAEEVDLVTVQEAVAREVSA